MPIYHPALLYGKKENKTIALEALGVPAVKATLDDDAKNYPHLAIESNSLWMWDVPSQTWVEVVPFVSLKTTHPIAGTTEIEQMQLDEIITLILVLSTGPELAAKIGTTSGGDEIMLEQEIPSGVWIPINVQIVTPVSIFVEGITSGTIKLYKQKI